MSGHCLCTQIDGCVAVSLGVSRLLFGGLLQLLKFDWERVQMAGFLYQLWRLLHDRDCNVSRLLSCRLELASLTTLCNASTQDCVRWNATGDGFCITDAPVFESRILPLYFKHGCVARVRSLSCTLTGTCGVFYPRRIFHLTGLTKPVLCPLPRRRPTESSHLSSFIRSLSYYALRRVDNPSGYIEYTHHVFHRDDIASCERVQRLPTISGRGRVRVSKFRHVPGATSRLGVESDSEDAAVEPVVPPHSMLHGLLQRPRRRSAAAAAGHLQAVLSEEAGSDTLVSSRSAAKSSDLLAEHRVADPNGVPSAHMDESGSSSADCTSLRSDIRAAPGGQGQRHRRGRGGFAWRGGRPRQAAPVLLHTAPVRQIRDQTVPREHHAACASASEDHLRGPSWGGWGSALGKCPPAMMPSVAEPIFAETDLPADPSQLSPADSPGIDCLLSPCVMDAASGMLIWRDLRGAPYEDVRRAHDAAAATLTTWRPSAPPRVVALLMAPPPAAKAPVTAVPDAIALRSEHGGDPDAGQAEMVDDVPISTAPAGMVCRDTCDRNGLAPCDATTWETARARSGPDAAVCRLAVIVCDAVGQSLRLLPLHSAFPETTAALVATWGPCLENFVAEVVSLGAGEAPPIATSLALEEAGGARQTIQVHHLALVAFQQRAEGRVGVLSSVDCTASGLSSSLNAVIVARVTYSSSSDSANRARLSRAQDASEDSASVLVKAQALVALLEHSGLPVVTVVSPGGGLRIAGSKRTRSHVLSSLDELLGPVVQATSPLGLARVALCQAEADLKLTAIAVASLLALVPVRSALVSLSCLADAPRLVPLLLLALTRRDDRRGQASRMELEKVPGLGPVAENGTHKITLPKITCAELLRDGIVSLPEHCSSCAISSDVSGLLGGASLGAVDAAWSLGPNPADVLSCASIVTVNRPTSGPVVLDQGCGAPRVRPGAIAAAAARLAFANSTGVSNRLVFWCDSRSLTALHAGLAQCLPILDAVPITFPTRVLSGGGSSLLADVNSAVHLSALGIFGGSTVDAVAEGAAAASLADDALATAVHATHIAELAAVEVTRAEKTYADAQALVCSDEDHRSAQDVGVTLSEPEAAEASVSVADVPKSSGNDAAMIAHVTAPGHSQLGDGVIPDSASAAQAREVLQSSFVQSVVALLARNVVTEAALRASHIATSAHKRATDLARLAPLSPPRQTRSQQHLASRPIRVATSADCPEQLLPSPQPDPLDEYPQATLASTERDVLLQWIIDHRVNPYPSKGT